MLAEGTYEQVRADERVITAYLGARPMSETSPTSSNASANTSADSRSARARRPGLSAWYGEARVLTDVTLAVSPGEVVTLVGRNGAGKTTLLRSVMGLHRQVEGADHGFDGSDLDRRSPTAVPRPASAGSPTTAASTPA